MISKTANIVLPKVQIKWGGHAYVELEYEMVFVRVYYIMYSTLVFSFILYPHSRLCYAVASCTRCQWKVQQCALLFIVQMRICYPF